MKKIFSILFLMLVTCSISLGASSHITNLEVGTAKSVHTSTVTYVDYSLSIENNYIKLNINTLPNNAEFLVFIEDYVTREIYETFNTDISSFPLHIDDIISFNYGDWYLRVRVQFIETDDYTLPPWNSSGFSIPFRFYIPTFTIENNTIIFEESVNVYTTSMINQSDYRYIRAEIYTIYIYSGNKIYTFDYSAIGADLIGKGGEVFPAREFIINLFDYDIALPTGAYSIKIIPKAYWHSSISDYMEIDNIISLYRAVSIENNIYKLDTPVLFLNGTLLMWNKIDGASGYMITWYNVEDNEKHYIYTANTFYNIVFGEKFSKDNVYRFTVRALASMPIV